MLLYLYTLRPFSLSPLDLLLISGTDLNRTDEFGFTPLLWACANGQLITVKYLLEMNVDLGIVGNHGENALLFSSCYGYSDIVKLLLQLGMNVNFTDEVNFYLFIIFFCKKNKSDLCSIFKHELI